MIWHACCWAPCRHFQVAPIAGDTAYRGGQKGAIVEFFGWPHADIAQECAFLANAGYMGAKFFPVQEQVMSTQPFQSARCHAMLLKFSLVRKRQDGQRGKMWASENVRIGPSVVTATTRPCPAQMT